MKRAPFSLWRFSIATYGAPGVAPACLALQEGCGADVNLLLYACFLGAAGRRLTAREMRRCTEAVASWQAGVVQPLRHARRAIPKEGEVQAARLRKRIAALEIAAEYLEQRALQDLADAMPAPRRREPPKKAIAHNLQQYFRVLGMRPPEQHVATLIAASQP